MNRKVLLVTLCIVSFAGSAATSWFVTKRNLEHERKVKEDSAMAELKARLERELILDKARRQKQLDELDARIAEQRAKADDVEERWQARETVIDDAGNALIPEKYVKRMFLYVFEGNRLSANLKAFLKLSPEQQTRADRLTEGLWKRFVAEERNHVTIKDTPNGFEVMVEPFPEAGKALKRDLYEGLRKIVPPDHWDLLLLLMNRDSFYASPYRTFYTFGTDEYRIVLEQKKRTTWAKFRRPIGTTKWLTFQKKLSAPSSGPEHARLVEYKPEFFNRLDEEKKLLKEMSSLRLKILNSQETWRDHRRLIELYKRFGKNNRPKYPIAHYADDRKDETFRLACVYYRLWGRSEIDITNIKKAHVECLQVMKELVKDNPKSARLWGYKAMIEYGLEELGQKRGEADKSLAMAVELDPKDPDVIEVQEWLKKAKEK